MERPEVTRRLTAEEEQTMREREKNAPRHICGDFMHIIISQFGETWLCQNCDVEAIELMVEAYKRKYGRDFDAKDS